MNQAANANLFSRLFDGLDDPKRLAVETQDGAHISYGDLIARAGQMANVLVARGVKPGDRVAVQVEKSVANIVLYLATVGVHPYRRPGDAREQQLLRLLIGDFERPSAVIAGYPPELEAIVLCAMSRDPEARFGTADEMRRKLQEWLQRSGPLVSEHDIARAVIERVGKSIQERTDRIQRVLATRPKLALAGDVTVSEPLPSGPSVSTLAFTLAAIGASPSAFEGSQTTSDGSASPMK